MNKQSSLTSILVFVWLFLVSGLLAACIPSTGTVQIKPSDVAAFDLSEATIVPPEPKDVLLFMPKGIYVLSRDAVFLFGDLSFANGRGRSVLLQSKDEGMHWKEVMTPLSGSSVMAMTFSDMDYGWAVVLYGTESPRNIAIFHSQNGGESWSPLVDQTNPMLGVPFEIEFRDRLNGQMVIEYALESRYAFVETTDGGVTWQEANSLPLDQYEVRHSTDPSQGLDGSEWQYTIVGETLQTRQIVIWQRISEKDEWIQVAQLPRYFNVVNGHVVVP